MGSKEKFWFRWSHTGERWLFKYSRAGSSASDAAEYCGEHWAEKIAAEIAATLGIPHADVQLARHGSMPGAIVRDFTEDPRRGELIHGNDLLFESTRTYPRTKRRRVVREHTIDNVLDTLAQHFISLPESSDVPPAIQNPPDLFVGYLLLDALIGNTDRHHENWAIISREGGARAVLAPSYDHASSLGRELTESERTGRLNTRDQRYTVEAYARRARSALFLDAARKQPLSPLDAFREAGRRRS